MSNKEFVNSAAVTEQVPKSFSRGGPNYSCQFGWTAWTSMVQRRRSDRGINRALRPYWQCSSFHQLLFPSDSWTEFISYRKWTSPCQRFRPL